MKLACYRPEKDSYFSYHGGQQQSGVLITRGESYRYFLPTIQNTDMRAIHNNWCVDNVQG